MPGVRNTLSFTTQVKQQVIKSLTRQFYNRCQKLLKMPASEVKELSNSKKLTYLDQQCISIILSANLKSVMKLQESELKVVLHE